MNTYTDYSHDCPKCHSILTQEQSAERMKISSNILDIQIAIANLEKNITKSKKAIAGYLDQKLDIEKEYKTLTSLANIKKGELTLDEHLKNQSKQMARVKYYEIKSNLSDKSHELDSSLKTLESNSKKLLAKQVRKKEQIEAHFKQINFEYSLIFNTVIFDINFLEFKQINESGAVKNQKFLALYMAYSKILMDHSSIELPFVLDSIVKDELDSDILAKSYKLVNDVFLSSDRQTFFAVLEDKIQLITSDCKTLSIGTSKRLLSKEMYEKLINELTNNNIDLDSDEF